MGLKQPLLSWNEADAGHFSWNVLAEGRSPAMAAPLVLFVLAYQVTKYGRRDQTENPDLVEPTQDHDACDPEAGRLASGYHCGLCE